MPTSDKVKRASNLGRNVSRDILKPKKQPSDANVKRVNDKVVAEALKKRILQACSQKAGKGELWMCDKLGGMSTNVIGSFWASELWSSIEID